MDNLAGERWPDGCANGWLDKVSSGHFTPTAPHFPLLRKTLSLQVSEASQLWSGTDDQAHQGESRGAGQIQGAVAERVAWGKPVRWNQRTVAPTGSCPSNRAPSPEPAGHPSGRRRHSRPATQARQWLQKGKAALAVGAVLAQEGWERRPTSGQAAPSSWQSRAEPRDTWPQPKHS